jgi:hypothetical protein
MTPGHGCDCGLDPTLDDVLRALSTWRRRCVLYQLARADDGVASVERLATTLAEAGPGADDPQQLRAILYHQVLPQLAAAGVVEFDTRSDDVRFRPDGLPENLLQCVKATERPD